VTRASRAKAALSALPKPSVAAAARLQRAGLQQQARHAHGHEVGVGSVGADVQPSRRSAFDKSNTWATMFDAFGWPSGSLKPWETGGLGHVWCPPLLQQYISAQFLMCAVLFGLGLAAASCSCATTIWGVAGVCK